MRLGFLPSIFLLCLPSPGSEGVDIFWSLPAIVRLFPSGSTLLCHPLDSALWYLWHTFLLPFFEIHHHFSCESSISKCILGQCNLCVLFSLSGIQNSQRFYSEIHCYLVSSLNLSQNYLYFCLPHLYFRVGLRNQGHHYNNATIANNESLFAICPPTLPLRFSHHYIFVGLLHYLLTGHCFYCPWTSTVYFQEDNQNNPAET